MAIIDANVRRRELSDEAALFASLDNRQLGIYHGTGYAKIIYKDAAGAKHTFIEEGAVGGDFIRIAVTPYSYVNDANIAVNGEVGITFGGLPGLNLGITSLGEAQLNSSRPNLAIRTNDITRVLVTEDELEYRDAEIVPVYDTVNLPDGHGVVYDLAEKRFVDAGPPKSPRVVLDTRWISGFTITQALDPAEVNISAGIAAHVDEALEDETPISCPELLNVELTYLPTFGATFLMIDQNCQLVQSPLPPTSESLKDFVYIGTVGHPNNVEVEAIQNLKWVSQQSPNHTLADLFRVIKPITVDGLRFSANGANLKMDRSEGTSLWNSLNADVDLKDPNQVTMQMLILKTLIK